MIFIYLKIGRHESIIHNHDNVSMFVDGLCAGFDVDHLQAGVGGGFNPDKLKQFSKGHEFKICSAETRQPRHDHRGRGGKGDGGEGLLKSEPSLPPISLRSQLVTCLSIPQNCCLFHEVSDI